MKKFILPVTEFWACICSVGISEGMPEKEVKYVRFTNVIALLTALAVFAYIPFSLIKGNRELSILQGIDALCILLALLLNSLGYNRLARHTYIVIVNCFVLINSCFIGYRSGVQDFFYIVYIIPFLLFSVTDYKDIAFGVIVSVVFFNLYQHIYPYFNAYNLDIQSQEMISNINLWMKFVLFGIAIYILSYYNFSTEVELALTNQKLQAQAQELKRSNEDLEQFAAIISHDLKAPVRNVSGFMTILMRKYGDKLDADAMSFVELSKNSSERMAKQIDDLLSYSKLGRDLPATNTVDVNEMIKTIRMELGEKISEKSATLAIESPLPTLYNVHSSMIHHVFQNLIANGIKFNTNEAPRIAISYTDHSTHHIFHIRDNGIGISEEYKQKVFQMFKRLHTEQEYEGTGIGLAVCKKIVDFYGGDIWMESQVGVGTSFYFSLPKHQVQFSLS